MDPAVNDPYTAVMSVERLTALLAALAPRRLGDIVLHDPEGPSRVVARSPTFADYIDLASTKSGATVLASRRSLTRYHGCFG